MAKSIEKYINQIICGDCLEVMKGFPDKSVDTGVPVKEARAGQKALFE